MSQGEQPKPGELKPDLRPPGAGTERVVGKTSKHGLVWGALSVTILLLLGVLLVLPKLVHDVDQGAPVAASGQVVVKAEESSPPAGQSVTKSRNDASKALQDFLHARARLELANAPVWGEPEWSQAIDGVARGNDYFARQEFSMAEEQFLKSLELLIQLEAETGQRLANALSSGWDALEADESLSASTFFEMAIAIDDDNESALEGLERARLRPELLQLMAAGELALSKSDLPEAQTVYIEAVELDALYEPALVALQEVTEEITNIAFRNAMSRALRALESEEITVAELALNQAASLKPGEQVVNDSRYRLEQLRQKLWLTSQRQEAAENERNEDWAGAVKIYRNVLAEVPEAAFARQKLERSEDRELLHRQLDHYLADPARVYSAKPRANAEKLIASTGEAPAGETRLLEKLRRLQALIIEARTPLKVTLQSDGLTNVLIYHVGQLGAFTSHQLELLPGVYTVVGSRAGYRDVRRTLKLKPGQDQPPLDIRCEETV
jgi:tetratricopeptide (TPR) repeat protein